MGAWGSGPFDNDDAGDWIAGLHRQGDLSYVEEALDGVLTVGSDYLEAPESNRAIAAAEAVARIRGRWGQRDGATHTLDEWVAGLPLTPSPLLISKARRAVARVMTEPSELLELVSETDGLSAWRQSLFELTSRLSD